MHFEQLELKFFELAIRALKNESEASGLPPEGSEKKEKFNKYKHLDRFRIDVQIS